MKKFLDKFYQITEKIGKQNVILLIFIFVILVITGLYQTFSLYTESNGISILDGIKTLQFILNEDTEETSVTIASGSSKNIAITVTNQEKINLQYGIYYSSSDDLSDVELGYLSSSQYSANDLIDADSSLIVEIKVYNNSDQDVTILFGTVYGVVNGGELILDDSKTLLEILYPYQYEVEYIESNGTQYIDTGIAPSNLSVQTELQYQYVSNLGTSADSVMGSRDNNDMSTRYYPSSLFGTTLDRHILGNGQFTTTSDLLKHTIVFNDAEHNYYLDGVLMSNLGTNFTPHYQPIYLFGLNTEGNFAYQSASRIYYCKIWDNEELVRDFIPVIDREGVPCLYDKVNDKLYYNENDGGDDFATNYTAYEVRVDRNFELTSDSLVQVNGMPENVKITELSIKNSSGTVVDGTLDGYDVYSVSYEMNGKSVEQKFVPVPSTSLTLTNALTNASFESEITDSYNGTWYRSTSIKRTGSYSAYFTCSSEAAFLRIRYGDIGAKDNDVYIRVHSMTDSTTLKSLLYVYEIPTSDSYYEDEGLRAQKYFSTVGDTYNQWVRLSLLTSPSSYNYEYFMLQYAQASGSGTGNVYWDDVMALVLDSETWDVTPTVAWLDRMIPDFTDTQTISW